MDTRTISLSQIMNAIKKGMLTRLIKRLSYSERFNTESMFHSLGGILKKKCSLGVAKVVEHLLSKCEALSSNTTTATQKN
jgi:hypothetical protein